ncbi:hypothetical protein BJ741DRAFT_709751 [Chytriomyces cf. hyalinus JEL632]|nr:hypothetical protein BJ741DRAFT_709751 [Chytriomyces cf. hyalinus JEL632]
MPKPSTTAATTPADPSQLRMCDLPKGRRARAKVLAAAAEQLQTQQQSELEQREKEELQHPTASDYTDFVFFGVIGCLTAVVWTVANYATVQDQLAVMKGDALALLKWSGLQMAKPSQATTATDAATPSTLPKHRSVASMLQDQSSKPKSTSTEGNTTTKKQKGESEPEPPASDDQKLSELKTMVLILLATYAFHFGFKFFMGA